MFFHVLLFINSLLIFSGINACFAGIFYGSHGITHSLLIFIGIRELKVRQIDYNIIFGWWFIPIMAISSVINLFFKGQMEYAIISFSVGDKNFTMAIS